MIPTVEIRSGKMRERIAQRVDQGFSSFETECRHIFMIVVSRCSHVAAGTVAARIFATKIMK